MVENPLLIFVFTTVIHGALGHLCLIYPEQRGAMDITRSGSSTCFRHGAPCGGQPPQSPGVAVFKGGQQMWIKIQQNFNHYEVGYPGYMDIAIAPLNSTDFQMLAFTPDYYVHAQDHQQNYTTIVNLPNIDCDHCVIRARYNPHKPGESTFYQCADIKITKSDESPRKLMTSLPPLSQELDPEYRTIKKKMSVLKYQKRFNPRVEDPYVLGLSYNPFDRELVNLVNISTKDGAPFSVNEYSTMVLEAKAKGQRSLKQKRRVSLKSPNKMNYIYDGVGTVNSNGTYVGLLHSGGPDEVSDYLVKFDAARNLGKPNSVMAMPIIGTTAPINALLSYLNGNYLTFTIKDDSSEKGSYIFEVGTILPQGSYYQYAPIMKSKPENLYINYMWAEYDAKQDFLYVLMGNENSPDRLQARIYTFDLQKQSVNFTEIAVDDFTFMAMHLDKRTGKLYAVSPRLFYSTNVQWFLVEVDPLDGSTTMVMQIAAFGYFARDYGGNVFNGISQGGVMYHAFKMYDTDANVIAAIDIAAKTVTFSDIANLRGVHNLALMSP